MSGGSGGALERTESMKIIVFGATGGSGRAIVARALAAGHEVTAFARDPARLDPAPGLRLVGGDAVRPEDVARAVPGHAAVIVSLGERPGRFDWLPGPHRSASSRVCELGTRNILAALETGAAARLVVISAFGVGETRAMAPWYFRIYFRLFLRDQMADKARQEALLKASDADFVLVQPVALTDAPATGDWRASTAGVPRAAQVSRGDLAAFIVEELAAKRHHRATVTFSG